MSRGNDARRAEMMWGQPPRLSSERSSLRRSLCPKGHEENRPGCARRTAEGGCPYIFTIYTGVAVFLGGLKNGIATTLTSIFNLMASMVTSICNCVPGFAYSVSTLASAINFFSTGDQLVVVALPACFSPE